MALLKGINCNWISRLRTAVLLFCVAQSAAVTAEEIGRREIAPTHSAPITVQTMASWAVSSGDNHNLPFIIVDKIAAQLFVFDPYGIPQASTAVLLGLARGDHAVPGLGERRIADIRPAERTTPAGRFVGEPGKNIDGENVVWIDYNAALSIHRVRPGPSRERRLERLASLTPDDNRISYGCVVVPAKFFEQVIGPTFARGKGIVYILPESSSAEKLFRIAQQ